MKRWIHANSNITDLESKILQILVDNGVEPKDCYSEEDWDDDYDAVVVVSDGDFRNVCDYTQNLVVETFKPDKTEYHELYRPCHEGIDSCTCVHLFLWEENK